MTISFRLGASLLNRTCLSQTYKLISHQHIGIYNQVRSAGHAKWQNIKSTKQANDLNKGRTISRYVQMVRRAIISGNMQIDPRLNSRLGEVLAEAAKFNVPKATLERAITRATNLKMISINLEISGPKGCTLIARCETENIPHLRRDVKKILRKHDATLAPDNSLINMFKSHGFVRCETKTIDGREIDDDMAEEAAITSNAEEVTKETYDDATDENLSQAFVFSTSAEALNFCKGELEKQGFKVMSCDLNLVPYREVDFGEEVQEKVQEIEKALTEMEQVIDVSHNVAISKEE